MFCEVSCLEYPYPFTILESSYKQPANGIEFRELMVHLSFRFTFSLSGRIFSKQCRRTIRSFTAEPLSLEQYSQIFWAAQGVTEDWGFKRAAPSGGGLYPMDIYSIVGENFVNGLRSGFHHYDPKGHSVSLVSEGDLRNKVADAALSQTWMSTAPLNIVITVEYCRITSKYGKRGERYAIIEAGHIGQNILLQSEAMGLGVGIVGAFDDEKLRQVVNILPNHEPLLILPVGYRTLEV